MYKLCLHIVRLDMSIAKGSLCKVTDSNYKDYVMTISSPYNNRVCALNKLGLLAVYDLDMLKQIKAGDLKEYLQTICSFSTNSSKYRDEKQQKYIQLMDFIDNDPKSVDYILKLIKQDSDTLSDNSKKEQMFTNCLVL